MAILTTQTIEYESAASQQSFAALTDSGDHTVFTATSTPWSQASGYEPVIGPYGVIDGGAVIPAVGAGNNNVDAAAVVLMAPGMTGASATTGRITVAADTDLTCTRGSSTNTHIINSITVNSSGAYAVVAGTATTAHSETRGASGGPPFIPVGSIEVAQVRLTSITAAPITADEIYQVAGTHQERYDYPVYSVDYLRGKITFSAALPLIHTGSVAKSVRVRVATPVFAEIANSRDWVPAETSNTTNSESYYDGEVGSVSSSLGQAGFTAALQSGVTDGILSKIGQKLIFRFKPSRSGSAYQLTQGVLGVARTFGVKSSPQGSFTVSPEQASVDFTGL